MLGACPRKALGGVEPDHFVRPESQGLPGAKRICYYVSQTHSVSSIVIEDR